MRRILVVLILLPLGACQSLSDVIEARADGGGTSEDYDVSESQAWELSRTVLRWNGADAIEDHRDQRYMLSSTSAGLFTMGTVMGVWLDPVEASKTRVTVITKRRVATNVITDLTESGFHSDFKLGLPFLRAGDPLPLKRPSGEAPAADT